MQSAKPSCARISEHALHKIYQTVQWFRFQVKKQGEFRDGFWKGFREKCAFLVLSCWISSHPKRHRASDPSRTRRWKQGRPCCSWRYGRLLARSAACPRKPIEWILEHGIWQSQNTKDFLLHSTHQGLYKALIIDKRSSILDKNCLHTSKCFSPWFTDPSCILSSIPRSVCMRTSSALSAMRWSSSHVSCHGDIGISNDPLIEKEQCSICSADCVVSLLVDCEPTGSKQE